MAGTGLCKFVPGGLRLWLALSLPLLLGASGDYPQSGRMSELRSKLDQRDCVILLHGLARSASAMRKMERSLQQDYLVLNQSYPSTKHPIDQLAEMAITPALAQCGKQRRINFVTHSLGGILVRQYLSQHPIANLGRTVMLGPPNKGSELSDLFAGSRLFRFYNGPTGSQLGTDQASVPITLGKVGFELGIIAGNKSFNPLFSSKIPGEDDGKVSVERSKIDGMNDHIVLPVSHTFMMRNQSVIHQVRHYLEYGKFDRSALT